MAIDTSFNPLSGASSYGLPSGTVSGSGGVVASSDNPVAVEEAVQLAANASAVVSLGNSIGSDGLTYNAVGVFDAIVDAGAAADTSPDLTQNQADQSLYQGILGGIDNSTGTAGIYNGSGEFTGLDTGFTTQLASLLKSDPSLTDSIVSDVATQGIVGALFSTTA